MAKVKVIFKKKVEVSGKTFEGEIDIQKPNMGQVADASEICSPVNPVGFTMAMVGTMLDIPYNGLRELDPDSYIVLLAAVEPYLPKI